MLFSLDNKFHSHCFVIKLFLLSSKYTLLFSICDTGTGPGKCPPLTGATVEDTEGTRPNDLSSWFCFFFFFSPFSHHRGQEMAFWLVVCRHSEQMSPSRFQPYTRRWFLHEFCWHPRHCFLLTSISANFCAIQGGKRSAHKSSFRLFQKKHKINTIDKPLTAQCYNKTY